MILMTDSPKKPHKDIIEYYRKIIEEHKRMTGFFPDLIKVDESEFKKIKKAMNVYGELFINSVDNKIYLSGVEFKIKGGK